MSAQTETPRDRFLGRILDALDLTEDEAKELSYADYADALEEIAWAAKDLAWDARRTEG